MKLFEVKDKIAIVTGASSGIGNGISKMLNEEGAVVICLGRRNDRLEELLKTSKNPQNIDIMICDVSNENQVKATVDTIIKKYGRIDILINNAGVSEKAKDITEHTTEQWDKVFDTNLKGIFYCSKYVANDMKKNCYGRIINIASIVGMLGFKTQLAYSASKSGVIGLTKAMCAELGEYNITVNAIAPGYILTEMTNPESGGCKYFKSRTTLGRVGNVEDLCGAALFLASDASAYITGVVIPVDGGMSANG